MVCGVEGASLATTTQQPNQLSDDLSSIYDLLADAYFHLGGYDPKKDDGDYPTDRVKSLINMIGAYGDDVRNVTSIDTIAEQFRALLPLIRGWLGEGNDCYNDYLQVIMAIDQFCEYRYEYNLMTNNRFYAKAGLNNLHNGQVQVFPRIGSSFINDMKANLESYERKVRGVDPSEKAGFRLQENTLGSNINSRIVKNYYIHDCRTDNVGKHPILHLSNPMYLESMMRRFNQRQRMVFGIFPVTNLNIRQICKFSYEGEYWVVDEYLPKYDDHLFDRYTRALDICIEEGIDIAVFPEMLLSPSLKPRVIEYAKSRRGEQLPLLSVLGTSWQSNMNSCTIIDCTAKEVFTQNKQAPFTIEPEGYQEKLSTESNKEVNLIQIEGLGRFVFPVCIDIKKEPYYTVIPRWLPDFIIAPAFTKSLLMQGEAGMYAKLQLSTTVFANTCSAYAAKDKLGVEEVRASKVNANKEVSFVTIPVKGRTMHDSKHVYIPGCDNCAVCGIKPCCGYKVEINYGEIEYNSTTDEFSPKAIMTAL